MSCTNPLLMINHGVKKNGKMDLRFCHRPFDEKGKPDLSIYDVKKLYGDSLVLVPCGKCDSCIETRTKQWAARCVLEASLYPKNSFITLTYNDNSLPRYGLCKPDVQKFLKRLRKYLDGKKIRYYCCGEYGPNGTHRPHYHMIIFNWFPDDAKYFKPSNFGDGNLYTSKCLQDLWPFGFSLVGEVTYQSCAYVARYCLKKQKFDNKYKCFSLMSLKPGIGYSFLANNFDSIYDTDKVYGHFGNSTFTTPFRYFDKVLESVDPVKLEAIKNVRVSNQQLNVAAEMFNLGFNEVEQLYEYKGELKKLKMDRLKRKDI